MILEAKALCFLSISIRSLLEEKKAISIPEKNAEKTNEISIFITSGMLLSRYADFPSSQIHGKCKQCEKKVVPAVSYSAIDGNVHTDKKKQSAHDEPDNFKNDACFIHLPGYSLHLWIRSGCIRLMIDLI